MGARASPHARPNDSRRDPPAIDRFATLISGLSSRLAAASGDRVEREVDACLGELLAFFGVEQCGIIEVQADIRQARLRHVAHVWGVIPAATTLEYGAVFPWTHDKTVIRGEPFVQTCIDDLPDDALVDRASSAAMGIDCLVTIPVGIGGRVTHVLCLTSSKKIVDWPAPVLSMLKTVADTFLAVLTRHNSEVALEGTLRNLAEAQRIAGVGSYVVDWRDDALTGSDVANRILGRELQGAARDVLDLIHPEDRRRVEDALAASLADPGPALDLEYRIVRADGAVRTVRSSMKSSHTPAGTALHTVVTIQDVSEVRAVEQEARQLRAHLRHADRVAHLGALTASLSHEVNQPLTGILANAQAALHRVRMGELNREELCEVLEAIVRDDKRAAAVIANVRTLLRRDEPPQERFDLAEALREVLTLFRSELDARRVTIHARLEPGPVMLGIRTQVQQVLVNLVANAIEALQDTRSLDRRVEVVLARRGRRAWLSVTDNGRGISPDRVSRIFEAFYTTRPEGLGMGLAISRSIVEAHGGEIDARNNEAGGATFTVVLPLERAARATRREGEGPPKPAVTAGVDGATIGIVDDDAGSRDGVARLLAAAGWRVVAYGSAADALASEDLRAAHCMLLDVQMPGMSGIELHGELQRRGIDVPTVFVTARGDAATGVEAMKRGALEYLTKPVDERHLLAAVSKAVARHAERAASARERADVERRIAELTPRQRDVMRLVIAGSLNKQIAAGLSISEATVKQHRGQVMAKMRVRSVADLVRLCETARFGRGD